MLWIGKQNMRFYNVQTLQDLWCQQKAEIMYVFYIDFFLLKQDNPEGDIFISVNNATKWIYFPWSSPNWGKTKSLSFYFLMTAK